MMPDNIDQNLRGGADSLPLFHCFIDQRLSFCVQLVRLFDDRLCPIEKIDQRLARRQRFLNLPKLCIAETGSVTNEVNEPVLQHSPPCCWLYRWPISGLELSPKVGDGGNRKGGISWGCLTPPLLHRRSDMPVSKDNIIKLIQPGNVEDQLTEILRSGARALLAQAVEAEVADFLGKHADLKTQDGHQRVVRHGHLPEREAMTGIGPVAVRQPRVRDREVDATDPARIRFSPSILPPYMRRSKSIETLLPMLYLKGISTGDFSEALAALLGKDAAGLSASAIGRLKEGWLDEHTAWQRRDLSAKRYVYIWADGIHLQARLEDEKQCILVLIGATPEGRKDLVGFTDGARESAQDLG